MMDGRTLIDEARKLAERAHAGQTYPPMPALTKLASKYDPPVALPFIVHPGQVVGVLLRYGVTNAFVLAAGWLHDVLEDDFDPNEIEALDRSLYHLVWSVTDEPGATRKEKKRATYPKIAATGHDAVVLKLADRIANVESSIIGYNSFGYYDVYQDEYPEFREALFNAGGKPEMWQHLDRLLQWTT